MTARNLGFAFRPKSVAVVGASSRPGSLGTLIAANMTGARFVGVWYPVNPKYESVNGLTCYSTIAELPEAPELAVIVTPPRTVPGLVKQLAALGTRAAVVVSSGFADIGTRQGARLQQSMLNAAKPRNVRILGPNSLGLIVPAAGLNASFAHLEPRPGKLALVSQSGGLLTAAIDWAVGKDIGFSHLVSLGSMADVDFADVLNYLAEDAESDAILVYIESIGRSRKFLSAARAAARVKPVIVLKGGRSAGGARAATKHSGAPAGRDEVYQAAFDRAGLLRVDSLAELFDMAAALSRARPAHGDRLAIVTNGGGMGVLAADALEAEGGTLATLTEATGKQLDKVLPATWSKANPIDIVGDAPASRYRQTLEPLQQDPNVDAILALHCPAATAPATEAAQVLIDTASNAARPIIACWVGEHSVGEARSLFAKAGIAGFASPAEAVHAFMQMVRYRRNQAALMETPASVSERFECNAEAAARIVDAVLKDGREWLSERERVALLAAYQIPTVESRFASGPGQAAEAARELGGPVALKIASPDIADRSDVGGVVLDLRGPRQVEMAALGMAAQLEQRLPKARIDGFIVQPMRQRRQALELCLAATSDSAFGPVLAFGPGGVAAEVIGDRSLALPPLNTELARQMMQRTRLARLLDGFADQPQANADAVVLTLIKLSQLVSDLAHIAELEINPLLASEHDVLALKSKIRVSADAVSGPARLAIRPYPRELEQTVTLPDGRRFLLRPIRAEDEPALVRGFQRLSAEAIRFRFHHRMTALDHKLAARLTQIDYDREMALVLTAANDASTDCEIQAVVRLHADPDRQRAEYAIIVSGHLTGIGVGRLLMEKLIEYARDQGIGELYGSVLAENAAMLALSRKLGFSTENGDEPGLLTVRLALTPLQSK